ncbi:MAG: YebC/PmpR family DNA-binding transcriptional regulator [Parcubacteria group bacterium]|nr:YebC/PmpR family DNA-binding transcriptional regulator [Parcubacteria group bacterium]
MSGHNKWSKVKHKKAAEDAKKSREFGKLAHVITLEAKRSGGDMDAPPLRAVIERARAFNMPQSNIERAVARAAEKDAALLETVTYEAYGPGGSALIIEGLSDNKNRTAATVKHLLTMHDATLAERGAASWAFKKEDGAWVPTTTVPLAGDDKEKMGTLIEALEDNDDIQSVYTNAV